jgi:hypothetical protein
MIEVAKNFGVPTFFMAHVVGLLWSSGHPDREPILIPRVTKTLCTGKKRSELPIDFFQHNSLLKIVKARRPTTTPMQQHLYRKCCDLGIRVARWFVFKPKILILVNFLGACNKRDWFILWPFGLFYGYL